MLYSHTCRKGEILLPFLTSMLQVWIFVHCKDASLDAVPQISSQQRSLYAESDLSPLIHIQKYSTNRKIFFFFFFVIYLYTLLCITKQYLTGQKWKDLELKCLLGAKDRFFSWSRHPYVNSWKTRQSLSLFALERLITFILFIILRKKNASY